MTYSKDIHVKVLLSAYNGEKYIGEQIGSILGQTHENLELVIRDDGSDDGTPYIIGEMAGKDSRITFVKDGERLGYPKCFYRLTDTAGEADIYFFSDQDDVWFPNKIERGVKALLKVPADKPAAYYAGYTICDEELTPVRDAYPMKKTIELKDTLFEVCGLEFTMAVNRAALELLNANKPAYCTGRGTWMSMLYSVYATIICENEPCAYYRRHESTFTASNQSFFGLWAWRFKYLFGGGFADFHEVIQDFYETVGSKLDAKQQKMLKIFASKKYFPYAFRKAFYPKRLRTKLTDELGLRAAFLLGRM